MLSPNKRKVIRLRPCTPVRPSPCSSYHPPIANTSGARISLHSRCEFLGRFLLDSLVSSIRPNVRNMRTDLLLFMPLMGPPAIGENKASAAQSLAVAKDDADENSPAVQVHLSHLWVFRRMHRERCACEYFCAKRSVIQVILCLTARLGRRYSGRMRRI